MWASAGSLRLGALLGALLGGLGFAHGLCTGAKDGMKCESRGNLVLFAYEIAHRAYDSNSMTIQSVVAIVNG